MFVGQEVAGSLGQVGGLRGTNSPSLCFLLLSFTHRFGNYQMVGKPIFC